ncbi:MAG: hypothetical protein ACP5OS_09420 [Leptospirillia bacterium]
MLILLRTTPDERLQKVISSVEDPESPPFLVYLSGALFPNMTPDIPPMILPERTGSLDPHPPAGILPLTQDGLLDLIHDHPRILVLP